MTTTTTTTTTHTNKKPKKFLNDPTNAVSEVISGLLHQYPNTLRKLQGHDVLLSPHAIVSSSSSKPEQRIALLSGGGSGHEPSHAGWIGKGMLSGAIVGGIFASPSVSSILAAIRAVTPVGGGGGCLLLVKNYTGDRLNFGLACELANAEHRPTRMILISDDCAIPSSKLSSGARGIAGTVLVHKTIGALAAQNNLALDELAEIVERLVVGKVHTLGVALETVTVPGATEVNTRLEGGCMEVGLGIHGEAGVGVQTCRSCDDIVLDLLQRIRDCGKKEEEKEKKDAPTTFRNGDELAVLVNNLGGTSNFEMSIVANSVVRQLEEGGDDVFGNCKVSRLYVGDFMTAFDMRGVSVSIVSLTQHNVVDWKPLLDADTTAPAWRKADVWKMEDGPRPSLQEIPTVTSPNQEGEEEEGGGGNTTPSYQHIDVTLPNFPQQAKTLLRTACQALIDAEPVLTRYDAIVGDGDCGITMERGAREVLQRLDDGRVPVSHPVSFFHGLADAVSESMGGTSGVLLELMFRKTGTVLSSSSSSGGGGGGGGGIDAECLWNALSEGVNAVSFYGGAKIGSRTMLDALYPALEGFRTTTTTTTSSSSSSSTTMTMSWEGAAKAAKQGAEGTALMDRAEAGRSNYLGGETLVGTPDPGAWAVGVVLEAMSGVSV